MEQQQSFYRISVKALVVDNAGRFLLAKEANGTWELLGGGLDHGEDPLVGLQREIMEETGLTITHASPTPAYFLTTRHIENGWYIANVLYEVRLNDLQFTPSDECTELRFFTVDEAREVLLYPNVKIFLDLYNPANHQQSSLQPRKSPRAI